MLVVKTLMAFAFIKRKLLTENVEDDLARRGLADSVGCCADVNAAFVPIHVLHRENRRVKLFLA